MNLRDVFPHPYTMRDAEGFIAHASATSSETIFAIDIDGAACGGDGNHPQSDVHRRSAEIGYWLGARFWGRGIATEAVRAATEHAFETGSFCRIFAAVFEHNAASARVLEKAGYVREGIMRKSVTKDGRTLDAFLYAQIR
jgi:RimJ/RimL family protein N-acetyltransferase